MAALLAATVHAPLTAVILLFEMTDDYHIILPLMFAVTVSLIISNRLERESVYTLGLVRKGIHLDQGRDTELLQTITVGELAQRDPPRVHASDSLLKAYEVMQTTRSHGIPVVDSGEALVGVITVQDLERAHVETGDRPPTVGEACSRELMVAYPDETMAEALRKMGARDIGRLPVVPRNDPQRLIGMLRRTDMVRAYNIALTRRAALRHRAHQVRLGAYGGMNVEELVIQPDSPCAGRRVREVDWPRDCVLASVRRGRRVLIPRGDTVLSAEDVLVAVCEGEAAERLRRLCFTTPAAQDESPEASAAASADQS
jgi:CIC family chloride channel protein